MSTIPGPTLAQFSRAASNVADDRTIKVAGTNVKSTGLPTWASTNEATMNAFLGALTKEFGDGITTAARRRLKTQMAGGKPLTARMVRETLEEAVALATKNINTRDLFFSGMDAEHSFAATFEKIVDSFPHKLDLKARKELEDAVKDELKARFQPGQNEFSLAQIDEYMEKKTSALHYGRSMFTGNGISAMPGADADKISLAMLLLNHNENRGFAVQNLPAMRGIQPEGKLTAQTVWQGSFGVPMPDGLDKDLVAFREAYSAKTVEHLDGIASGKGEGLRQLCEHMPLPTALAIMNNPRPIMMGDLSAPQTSILVQKSKLHTGEQLVARDAGRRAATASTGTGTIVSPPMIDIGGTHIRVGKENGLKFNNDEDETNFRQGKPSSFSSNIMAQITTFCGGASASAEQVNTLAIMCSQSPMRALMGTGGAGIFQGLFPSDITEHASTTTRMTSNESPEGSVRVRITTNQTPEVVAFSGGVDVSFDVLVDGSIVVRDMTYTPPGLPQQ